MDFLNFFNVKQLLVLVLLELLVMLACLLFLGGYSRLKSKILLREKKWNALINETLTNVIITGGIPEDCEIDKLIDNRRFRALFLKHIVDAQDKFSGSASENLITLFRRYRLEDTVVEKLRSNNTKKIALALRVIGALKLVDYVNNVEHFIHSKSKEVYSEAQYSLVALRGFEGLDFLTDFKEPMSDWQQLRLLKEVGQIPPEYIEYVTRWLHTDNVYVLYFCFRLIRKEQLFVFLDKVVAYATHPDEKVRIQVVKTIAAFENEENSTRLIEMFVGNTEAIQFEILKALKYLRNSENEEFFVDQLQNNKLQHFKVLAAESLVGIRRKDRLSIMLMEGELKQESMDVIKYVLKESV